MIKRTCLVAAIALSMAGTTVQANWTEQVNGGALQQSWGFGSQTSIPGAISPFVPTLSGNDILFQSDSVVSGGNIAMFGTELTESFTDVRVSADVHSTSDNFFGLGLRSDLGTDSYVLLINGDTGWVEIVRVGSASGGTVNELAASPVIPNFASYNGNFHMVFEAVGDQLDGYVYDVQGGTLLAEVHTTDSNYTSGNSGVIASWNFEIPGNAAQGIDARFDNINSRVIPEPASLALLGLGGLLMLRRR